MLTCYRNFEVCPHECHQLDHAFISFNDVVTFCYSRNLLPQYKTSSTNFKDAYLKLSLNFTPKVQAVFYHIEKFYSEKLLNHYIRSSKGVEKLTWFEMQNILYTTTKNYYKQCICSTALIFSLCLYDGILSSTWYWWFLC